MAIVAQYSTQFSNVLSASVDVISVVNPPQISPARNPIKEGEPLVINWSADSNGAGVQFDVATDPNFSTIVSRPIGYGSSVSITLSRGTYWIRASWLQAVSQVMGA